MKCQKRETRKRVGTGACQQTKLALSVNVFAWNKIVLCSKLNWRIAALRVTEFTVQGETMGLQHCDRVSWYLTAVGWHSGCSWAPTRLKSAHRSDRQTVLVRLSYSWTIRNGEKWPKSKEQEVGACQCYYKACGPVLEEQLYPSKAAEEEAGSSITTRSYGTFPHHGEHSPFNNKISLREENTGAQWVFYCKKLGSSFTTI